MYTVIALDAYGSVKTRTLAPTIRQAYYRALRLRTWRAATVRIETETGPVATWMRRTLLGVTRWRRR